MKVKRPTQVTLDLGDLTALNGRSQIIFRVVESDKNDLEAAADRMKMSTAQFVRMVVIQAARKVLAEVA
jgi:uncharacterized protein (DUF1778 family)